MKHAISIIIPVYNAEKTIRRAVESLLFGTNRDVQIVLAEDCSKDNSWQVCQELAEQYTQVVAIRNETNCGVSYTRNQALRIAHGEYVLFVDSDDWVSKDYVAHLLATKQAVTSSNMVMCGYHFIDKTNDSRNAVIFDCENSISEIPVECAFSIMENVLLQQLWNKIFRREIIEKYNIRFDETQSMGEDFQFVLDYMEAAQIQKCVVLNEPLYYYIRWNNTSLMSNFGFIDNQPEFDRIDQLARIAGPKSETRREAMHAQIKRNYIYHITRNPGRSKQEKLDAIERIMGDGKAASYYREQLISSAKEQLAAQLSTAKHLVPRLKGRLQRSQIQKRIAEAIKGVNAEGITFISQNCIGGVLYHDLGLPFLSPTINAFIPEPGFVKMVLNLRHYMDKELVMRWGEEYPIGKLDEVEIHFMHYDTCKAAKEDWDRRKARINWDKIFVIGTDRDGFTEETYTQWKKIEYPKILFTAHPEFAEDAVYFPEYSEEGQIEDLISGRKFYSEGMLVRKLEHR